MSTVYRIRDWNEHFENDRTRRADNCSFVCVPNKQHGIGFSYIMAEPDGMCVYGAWGLIIGLCSQQKNPRRGWLTRDGKKSGIPLTPLDMALKWKREESEIQRALEFLSSNKVEWIEAIKISDLPSISDSPDSHLSPTGESPKSKSVLRKDVDALAIPQNINNKKFLEAWSEWKSYRSESNRPLTPMAAAKQLSAMSGMGSDRAIRALNHSMMNQWQGIFEPKSSAVSYVEKRKAGGNF